MNRDCDITQDLLFGYNDETLNFGSKEFVENHLKTCENCKKIYEEIKKDKDPEMIKILLLCTEKDLSQRKLISCQIN